MKLLSFNLFVFLIFLIFSFSSCGDKNSSESNQVGLNDDLTSEEMTLTTSSESSSKASEYQEKPCELLTEEIVKKYVTTDKEIISEFTEAGEAGGIEHQAFCNYTWERMSEEEASEKLVDQMMSGMSDPGAFKIDHKSMQSEYFITISMKDYEGNEFYLARSVKLTDEQIEQKAQQAAEQAMESETFKEMNTVDKEAYTKEAAETTKSMLIKIRDETVEVEGLGEDAYFSSGPTSSYISELIVLSGRKIVFLTAFASEDNQENKEIALKMAKEIL